MSRIEPFRPLESLWNRIADRVVAARQKARERESDASAREAKRRTPWTVLRGVVGDGWFSARQAAEALGITEQGAHYGLALRIDEIEVRRVIRTNMYRYK